MRVHPAIAEACSLIGCSADLVATNSILPAPYTVNLVLCVKAILTSSSAFRELISVNASSCACLTLSSNWPISVSAVTIACCSFCSRWVAISIWLNRSLRTMLRSVISVADVTTEGERNTYVHVTSCVFTYTVVQIIYPFSWEIPLQIT